MADKKTAASSLIGAGSKRHHAFWNLYIAMLPLSGIFLLDILPSRVSLIIIGHLTTDIYKFDSIFLAYAFTNFFSVFVLSLSCGLDTLSPGQLQNISYLRNACFLVVLGLIPYLLASVFAERVLIGIHQPTEIIETTAICVRYLIPYSICYIIFAMLRKSLLQYLHTTLLIGFMFARLCIHLMIGYALFYYTDLNFYAFLISDSCSMLCLLLVTVITLSKMIDLKTFLRNLITASDATDDDDNTNTSNDNRAIMQPHQATQPLSRGGSNSNKTNNAGNTVQVQQGGVFYEYINATMIPGSISCLEWWAVETFTFLVGALRYDTTSLLQIFFVHSCWASYLLIFQMPMLGLSVAMAAIMTADIRRANYYPALYTFFQAMMTVIVYCVAIALVVIFLNAELLNLFYPMRALTDEDSEYNTFMQTLIDESESISVLFVLSIGAYSIAMCFLGIFVSVGHLARGGMFMLIGYYISGLVLAVILGFGADWKFYGIWFGYCGGFVVWCLLSGVYWVCSNWKNEMKTMKARYDELDRAQKIIKNNKAVVNSSSYGATANVMSINQKKGVSAGQGLFIDENI